MGIKKDELRKVLKLDAFAAFVKLAGMIFVIFLASAVLNGYAEWYFLLSYFSICIILYMMRVVFIRKRFETYSVVYARVTGKNNNPFTNLRGTRFVAYSYEYESKTYGGACTIPVLWHPYLIKDGSTIRIIVSTENPRKSRIMDLFI